jgi:glyoxylase-like metal-dependent hydrolase (beta-lactamase superfamily II)
MNDFSKTYQIGAATVTRVVELDLPNVDPAFLYPDIDSMALAEHGHHLTPGSYDPRTGRLTQSIHSWVVRLGGRRILIDTSTGNDKDLPSAPLLDHLHGPFLQRLAAIGIRPEEVDLVVLTHLHADHVGWNTRLENGRWVPTFPNARHVFSRTEQRYNASLSGGEPAPDLPPATMGSPVRRPYPRVYEQSVVPIIEAGLAELIEVNGADLFDGFSYLPTPGHSVDHASIRLRSRGQEALFLGDVLHHPLQVHLPDLRSAYCEFLEPARASRRWALEYAAEHQSLCFSTHFPESSAGRISRHGDTFHWEYL